MTARRAAPLLSLLLLLLLAACGSGAGRAEGTRMTPFPWWPTESAPADAPMFLMRADIRLADGGVTYVPDNRVVSNGLGEVGSTHVVGAHAKVPPAGVAISWFSFVEDRFYEGDFPLPAEKIAALAAAGAALPGGGKEPYTRIAFGMAPGGELFVWLRSARVTTEVARLRAAPAERPWTDVLDNPEISRADYIAATLAEARQEMAERPEERALPSPAAWPAALTPVPWTPQLAGGADKAVLWIRALDGRRDWVELPAAADPRAIRPLPARLQLERTTRVGSVMTDIILDPAEVLAAFAKLGAVQGPAPLELVLEPEDAGHEVDLFLRRGELLYRFERTTQRVAGGG